MFLSKLFIQNQSKPSITEKKQNEAKYTSRDSAILKLVKKPGLSRTLAILSDATVRRSAVD